MISFKQYIYEAWGHSSYRRPYENELKDLFSQVENKFKKAEERAEKRKAGKQVSEPRQKPTYVLSKYPIAILIDKVGFEPVMEKNPWSKKQNINLEHYGAWLWDEVQNGNIKQDDLIDWWLEYDTEIAKNQWFDIKYVVKHLDPSRIFNIFEPESNRAWDIILADPGKIFSYTKSNLRLWYLSDDEKTQILNYYADPVNKDTLVNEIKKVQKKFEKFRPHISKGAEAAIETFLGYNVYINDKRCDDKFHEYYMELNRRSSYNGYYQGGDNYKDEATAAYYSLVMNVLDSLYGIKFVGDADFNSDGEPISAKYTYSGKENNDENIRKFVKEYNNLKLNIKNLGSSKDSGKTSGVHSSSFWTFYRNDFEVTVINKETEEEIYKKRFDNVTVGSDYYSGGW
jgi:hypothetical protein